MLPPAELKALDASYRELPTRSPVSTNLVEFRVLGEQRKPLLDARMYLAIETARTYNLEDLELLGKSDQAGTIFASRSTIQRSAQLVFVSPDYMPDTCQLLWKAMASKSSCSVENASEYGSRLLRGHRWAQDKSFCLEHHFRLHSSTTQPYLAAIVLEGQALKRLFSQRR